VSRKEKVKLAFGRFFANDDHDSVARLVRNLAEVALHPFPSSRDHQMTHGSVHEREGVHQKKADR
jgi:hypothetical protein